MKIRGNIAIPWQGPEDVAQPWP